MTAAKVYLPMIAYVVTNEANGRQYVGITKQTLRRRWSGHLQAARKGVKTALYAAIRKYGEAAFRVEAVASAATRSALAETEATLIVQFRTKAPCGYNLTDGGDGARGLDPATIERVAAMNRGRRHTQDARRRIGEKSKGHFVSAETRAAIGRRHQGRALSAEHRAKLTAAKTGLKMAPRTAEHASRISEGLRAAWARRRANV